MLLLHTLPPLPGTPGEIMLPQIHIRHKHFPKDYAPDKSLHFSTWFIAEYIVCLHMQEQITNDLYLHNDYCSDSFTPWYIDVRANHLYKKGRGIKEWMTIQSNKKDKRLKKSLAWPEYFPWPEESFGERLLLFLLLFVTFSLFCFLDLLLHTRTLLMPSRAQPSSLGRLLQVPA